MIIWIKTMFLIAACVISFVFAFMAFVIGITTIHAVIKGLFDKEE